MSDIRWESEEYGLHYGPVVSRHGSHDVIACKVCGYKHIIPLPSAADLKKLYEEEFYQGERPDYLSENEADLPWKRLEMQDRLEIAESLLPPSAARVAYDIGTGPGSFLSLALERGWAVGGIEPSPIAADYCTAKGLDVVTGFFTANTSIKGPAPSFIHMSEVLEHVPNPAKLLARAYELLAPGGVLCVSTPNDYNGLQQAVVGDGEMPEWWVLPDHHLNYFSHDSLAKLIEHAGFHVASRSTNFPMELFHLLGEPYAGNAQKGRAVHKRRMDFEHRLAKYSPKVRKDLYAALAHANLGRLAIIYAQKAA